MAVNDRIRFRSHPGNVGYDRNLYSLLKDSDTDYVLLLSDDDMLEQGALESISNQLRSAPCHAAFVRSRYSDSLASKVGVAKIEFHRDYPPGRVFSRTEICGDGAVVYNAILFSGLIFSRAAVAGRASVIERYFDSIYIQVAVFCLITADEGCRFLSGPGVMTGSDGVSGFGLNANAKPAERELIDRSSAAAEVRYNKRLCRLVDQLSEYLGREFRDSFYKEYRLRSVSGMRRARAVSRSALTDYWRALQDIPKKPSRLQAIIYLALWILPSAVSSKPLAWAQRRLQEWRRFRVLRR
jgi:hypothetical protein